VRVLPESTGLSSGNRLRVAVNRMFVGAQNKLGLLKSLIVV